MPLSPKLYTFLCGCFAALGSVLFGYDLGVISSVLTAPDFLRTTGLESDSAADANYIGFIVSAFLLGAFVGSIPAGLIADRFSRRTAISIGAVVFLIGGVLQTAAQNKEMMMAGRFFAGTGVGMLAMLAPLYQSEIAHPSRRGSLLALQQFMLGVGAVIAGWIGYGCDQGALGTALQWRLPLGIQNLPAIPLLFIALILPESPRWLMIRGREEEALLNLAKLHANGNLHDAFVKAEFAEMKMKITEEAQLEQGWKSMITNRQTMRKVLLGIILQFSVQTTGVSAIQYYSPTVFKSVGFSTSKTLLIQSLNNVNALFGEIACILFLDKFGRRKPLIGANLVAGSTFVVAAALAQRFAAGKGSYGQGVGFVAMTFIFNFAFSCAIGPISWAYPVEIMNTGIRAKGTALSSMSAWMSNFIIGQVSPIAFRNIGWKYYLVFAVCGFTNALTMWALYPETRGRSLEMMDSYFEETGWIVPLSKNGRGGIPPRDAENAVHEGVDYKQNEKGSQEHLEQL